MIKIDKADSDMAMMLARLNRKADEADITADKKAKEELKMLEGVVGQMVIQRIEDGNVDGICNIAHTLSSYMSCDGKSLQWQFPKVHEKLSGYLDLLNGALRQGRI